jgi:hypothetical protein
VVRRFGDIDVAEEAVQDAFVEAVKRRPVSGNLVSEATLENYDALVRPFLLGLGGSRVAPSPSSTSEPCGPTGRS